MKQKFCYPFLFQEIFYEKVRFSLCFACFLLFGFGAELHDSTVFEHSFGGFAVAFAGWKAFVLSDERNGNFANLDD